MSFDVGKEKRQIGYLRSLDLRQQEGSDVISGEHAEGGPYVTDIVALETSIAIRWEFLSTESNLKWHGAVEHLVDMMASAPYPQ